MRKSPGYAFPVPGTCMAASLLAVATAHDALMVRRRGKAGESLALSLPGAAGQQLVSTGGADGPGFGTRTG